MILEGDTSVLDAIKEKKRLSDTGEKNDHINILCIVDGGLMKGAYGAGAGVAMEKLGFIDVFNNLVGISSGAPSVAYYLSGNTEAGASTLYEECCTKQFFNGWRWNNLLDTKFIVDVFATSKTKAINTKKVFESKRGLYIGLTDYETAKPLLLQPQNEEELFEGIRGSVSMPGLVKEKIWIRGRRYLDGAASIPHPIQEAIETIPATHVLILTNQDKGTADIPFLEKFVNRTILRWRFSRALLDAANKRRRTRHEYVAKILSKEVETPVCLVWGDGSISSFENNPEIVKSTIDKSEKWWTTLLQS